MIRIISILLLISISSYSYKLNKEDYCLYSFSSSIGARSKNYDAELKIEVKDIQEKENKFLIVQRNGAITVKKDITLKSILNKDNALDSFLEIMKVNTKKEIILKDRSVIEDYIFNFRDKKYSGYLIKATIGIEGKLYRITYMFSNQIPVLGLFRFTITQYVESKKKYKFKNVMLIKECYVNGKIVKL